jgi:CRP/FNR family transcriptional regulator, anaerobic regulatory protein
MDTHSAPQSRQRKGLEVSSVAFLEASMPVRRGTHVRPRAEAAIVQFPTRCSTCALHTTCLPCGLIQQHAGDLDQLIHSRRRIRRGEHLYHAGDPFKSLYAFRLGFFKSYVDTPDGQTQVIGFPMAGEVVGMDGIETDRHRMSVVALDDGEICVIPYARLQEVALRVPALHHQTHRMMSREIVREQEMMVLLGRMRAESRVAAFLAALSDKFAARGYSASQFHLRMTREEIGSYLGLKLETVSRTLSQFQERGLVEVELRSIKITDLPALKAVISDS